MENKFILHFDKLVQFIRVELNDNKNIFNISFDEFVDKICIYFYKTTSKESRYKVKKLIYKNKEKLQ